MHNKVVFRAAAGLVDAGLTTLKFNFRGVGASTGTHNEIEGGREDVRDVLDYMTAEYPGRGSDARRILIRFADRDRGRI